MKLYAGSQAPQLFYTTCRPVPVKLEQYEAELNEEDACHLNKGLTDENNIFYQAILVFLSKV